MPINIELKAKVQDFNFIKATLSGQPETLTQIDTYVKFKDGRLKLREILNQKAQVIFYQRENQVEAKASYFKVYTYRDNSEYIKAYKNFKKNFGFIDKVEKVREYYRFENIRIHLDEVDGLGKFIEIEVVVKNETDVDLMKIKADNFFFNTLKISKDSLIEDSYIDLKTLCTT